MRNNVRKLILGNGLAQFLQFISILILSRIYLPSDFGLLAQVQSIAMVTAILVTLQLHLTIPLCKSATEARASVGNVQTLSIFFFLVFILPAIFLGKVTAFALTLSFFLGLTNTYNSYLVFNGKFGRLSGFYIIRAAWIIVLQIIFALLSISDGLVWATLCGEGFSAGYLRYTQIGISQRIRFNLSEVLDLANKFKTFSVYGTLQEIISVSAFYAPLFLFSAKYGEEIGGQYAMSNRLVWAPVVLLSSSVAQVLYHRFGKEPPTSTNDLKLILPHKTIFIAMMVLCIISFYLHDFYLFLLGPKWGLASQFLPMQLLWGVFFLASTPFRVICRVLHLQKYQLTIDAGMLVLVSLLFLFPHAEPLSKMLGILIIAFFQHALMVGIIWRRVQIEALKV